jgi:hypothetical protein
MLIARKKLRNGASTQSVLGSSAEKKSAHWLKRVIAHFKICCLVCFVSKAAAQRMAT